MVDVKRSVTNPFGANAQHARGTRRNRDHRWERGQEYALRCLLPGRRIHQDRRIVIFRVQHESRRTERREHRPRREVERLDEHRGHAAILLEHVRRVPELVIRLGARAHGRPEHDHRAVASHVHRRISPVQREEAGAHRVAPRASELQPVLAQAGRKARRERHAEVRGNRKEVDSRLEPHATRRQFGGPDIDPHGIDRDVLVIGVLVADGPGADARQLAHEIFRRAHVAARPRHPAEHRVVREDGDPVPEIVRRDGRRRQGRWRPCRRLRVRRGRARHERRGTEHPMKGARHSFHRMLNPRRPRTGCMPRLPMATSSQ